MLFSSLALAEEKFYFDEYGAVQRTCQSLYSDLGIKSALSVEKIAPEMKTGRFPLSEIPAHQKGALYVGVARNEGFEGKHHYYLMVDGMRFDGQPFYGKAEFRKTSTATNGVLFEIPVPPDVAKALVQRIRRGGGGRDISCLHSLCRLLEAEGVVIEGVSDRSPIRASVVVPSLVQGKVQVKGLALDPATQRWIATGDNEATEFLKNAMDADEGMKLKLIANGIGAFVVGTGSGTYAFFLLRPSEGNKK